MSVKEKDKSNESTAKAKDSKEAAEKATQKKVSSAKAKDSKASTAKAKDAKNEKSKVYEDPDAIVEGYSSMEAWLIKNKNKVAVAVGAVILIAFGLWFWSSSNAESNMEANNDLYPAQYYFDKDVDSLRLLALNGDAPYVKGFETVAKKHEGTDAANLANYYIGVINMRLGGEALQDTSLGDAAAYFKRAEKALKEFSADDQFLQGAAYSLIGDANIELNNVDEAIKYFEKAVDYEPNDIYTPQYLMKLAVAYEVKGDYAKAALRYKKIVDEYPNAGTIVQDAKKYQAMAESKAGK